MLMLECDNTKVQQTNFTIFITISKCNQGKRLKTSLIKAYYLICWTKCVLYKIIIRLLWVTRTFSLAYIRINEYATSVFYKTTKQRGTFGSNHFFFIYSFVYLFICFVILKFMWYYVYCLTTSSNYICIIPIDIL